MRRLLVAAAMLLAVPLARADEGWVIERLDFRLEIQGDGSINAIEALDVDFRGLQRHGIFRDLVSIQSYDAATNRRYDIKLLDVTDSGGRRQEVKRSPDTQPHKTIYERAVVV